MTKIRKVVAAALAFLMIFSSVSVLASAFDPSGAPDTLTVKTEFFKLTGEPGSQTWTPAVRAARGETVKARVSLGTDYFSNQCQLLFFYSTSFFNIDLATDVAVNSESAFVVANGITVEAFAADDNIESDDYTPVGVAVKFGTNPRINAKYDASEWLFEFTFTIKADAAETGYCLLPAESVAGVSNTEGFTNVPKGAEGEVSMNDFDMFTWYEGTPDLTPGAVSVENTLTLDANGGAYGGVATKTYTGFVNEPIPWDDATLLPEPERADYAFVGYTLTRDPALTSEEVEALRANPYPYPVMPGDSDAPTLYAYWLKKIDVRFDFSGGTPPEGFDPAAYLGVVPGEAFVSPGDPTKVDPTTDRLMHFKGWAASDSAAAPDPLNPDPSLPSVYPENDAWYFAVWTPVVTVTYMDADGNMNLNVHPTHEPFSGPVGDPFTETPAYGPDPEGRRFIGWDADVRVFPAGDLEVHPVFEVQTYPVSYFIERTAPAEGFDLLGGGVLPYGTTIPKLPNGYAPPTGHTFASDAQAYTDAALTVPFDESQTMPAGPFSLYYKAEALTASTYPAEFYVDGELYASSNCAYGALITAPAQDPAKPGFLFLGWTPQLGVMDSTDGKRFDAAFEKRSYPVKYVDADDGDPSTPRTVYAEIPVFYGEPLDLPDAPYMLGYRFVDWFTDDGTFQTSRPSTMPALEAMEPPASELYLYPKFDRITQNVTFYANGGLFSGDQTGLTAEIATGDPIASPGFPETPERKGYDFLGWKLRDAPDAAPPGLDDPAHVATADLGNVLPAEEGTGVVYDAVWSRTKISVQVVVVYNDVDDSNARKEITVNIDKDAYGNDIKAIGRVLKIVDPANPPASPSEDEIWISTAQLNCAALENYEFDAANPGEGATLAVTEESLISPDFDKVEMNPVNYIPKKYAVIFDANGGCFNGDPSDTETTKAQSYGSTVQQLTSEEEPKKAGFGFIGWSVRSDATQGDTPLPKVVRPDPDAVPPVENRLYAVWAASGNTPYKVQVKYADLATPPNYIDDGAPQEFTGVTGALIKDYYQKTIRDGFFYDPLNDNNAAFEAAAIGADGNTVVDIYYDRLPFDAIFNANGGLFPDSSETRRTSALYEANIAAPQEEPTKEGYVFLGWNTDPNAAVALDSLGQTGTNEVTFYAVWAARTDVTYTVEIYDSESPQANPTLLRTVNFAGTTGYAVDFDLDPDNPLGPAPAGTIRHTAADVDVPNYHYEKTDPRNVLTGHTVAAAGDLVVKLYYAVDRYAVTFKPGDGLFSTTGDKVYLVKREETIGDALARLGVGELETPEKNNYHFVGWLAEGGSDLMTTAEVCNVAVSGPCVYTAQYEIDKYPVTFDARGGMFADARPTVTVSLDYGSVVDPSVALGEDLSGLARAGYLVAGWTTDPNAPVVDNDASHSYTLGETSVPANDGLTVYVVWKGDPSSPANYEVHYMFERGANDYVEKAEYPCASGSGTPGDTPAQSGFVLPATPSGYVIDAARSDYNTVLIVGGVSEPTAAYVYYNRKTDILVRFNANGGLFGGVEEKDGGTATFDTVIADPGFEAERAGFHRVGWSYTQGENNGPKLDELRINADPATVFYAVWEPNDNTEYKIKIFVMDVHGEYPNDPASTLTRTGTTNETQDLSDPTNPDHQLLDAAASTALAGLLPNLPPVPADANGFELDDRTPPESNPNVLSGVVTADGSLELKVYYARKTYVVTFDGESGTEYHYGEEVPEPDVGPGEEITGYEIITPNPDDPDHPTVTPAPEGFDFPRPADEDLDGVTIKPIVQNRARDVEFYDYATDTPSMWPHAAYAPELFATVNCRMNEPVSSWPLTAAQRDEDHNGIDKGYEFVGWYDAPQSGPDGGNAKHSELTAPGTKYDAAANPPVVPPVDGNEPLKLYAHYEKKLVKLMPLFAKKNATIDRGGATEKWKDSSADPTRAYAQPTNYKKWFVYGLKTGMTDAALGGYVEVVGWGHYTLTPVVEGRCGTGALIKVFDDITGSTEPVEEFYVVIFGDLNGDGLVAPMDKTLLSLELNSPQWSTRRKNVPYKVKAMDLDGNGLIQPNDVGELDIALASPRKLSQATGRVTH